MKHLFQQKRKEQIHKILNVISEAHLWAMPLAPELMLICTMPILSHVVNIFWVPGFINAISFNSDDNTVGVVLPCPLYK